MVKTSQSEASRTLLTRASGPKGLSAPMGRPRIPAGSTPAKTYTLPIAPVDRRVAWRSHGQACRQAASSATDPKTT